MGGRLASSDEPGHGPAGDRMGRWQATALVVGSIVGVGIFSQPHSLASFGPISLVAMLVTSVGALALAMVFSAVVQAVWRLRGGPG